jgi:hypothetical protein
MYEDFSVSFAIKQKGEGRGKNYPHSIFFPQKKLHSSAKKFSILLIRICAGLLLLLLLLLPVVVAAAVVVCAKNKYRVECI